GGRGTIFSLGDGLQDLQERTAGRNGPPKGWPDFSKPLQAAILTNRSTDRILPGAVPAPPPGPPGACAAPKPPGAPWGRPRPSAETHGRPPGRPGPHRGSWAAP